MRQLKELVLQLRDDNERLRREQAVSSAASVGPAPAGHITPGGAAAFTERLVVLPRDRKCPMFSGKAGISIEEWLEEIQACVRARHLSLADQALYYFDHLEGEAKEEIKFRPSAERGDPAQIIAILKELYGCSQSYVTLQQAFFSRHQLEGETLLEFSLALMALMTQVTQRAPDGIPNADVLLRDQFAEHVLDSSLRRELKQSIRRHPTISLLEIRSEAIRWEREGLPGGARGRSFSLPSAYGLQYGVQGHVQLASQVPSQEPGFRELMKLMKHQQEQLNQLTQTVVSLQASQVPRRANSNGHVICRRCQRPGHYARECDGERVPSRPSIHSGSGANAEPLPRRLPEN